MIAFLSGKLLSKAANSVIIDVGGVGYEVTIPLSTFYELEEPGAAVALSIFTYVREDALQLFGFRTMVERELFLLLISVSGVGPKLGITLLSGLSAAEMIVALRTGNLVRLTAVPGVGKKTAERLVIELRDKVVKLVAAQPQIAGDRDTSNVQDGDGNRVMEDTLSALVNLGYQKSVAEKALILAAQDGGEVTVQALLRRSLRNLSKA